MKPSVRTLGEILYSPSQYVIPVFQRNYRWDRPQWQKLWASLLDVQSPNKTGNHFMGFLVFVPGLPQPGHHTQFHLIDGQQRLTTSSLLLAALRNVARECDQTGLADEVHDYFLVHPMKKGDQHFRVLPKARDQLNYIAIVRSEGEASGRMADALDYFEDQIRVLAADDPEQIRLLHDTINQRLEFMCATLEAENSYNIFKSLNSTGVALGPADLIRNFVFMHVAPDGHDSFDQDLWSTLEGRFSTSDGLLDETEFSRFFRDFLMADGRYVPPSNTFSSFEARYEATGFSPQELARGLLASAAHYDVIRGKVPDEARAVTVALAELNALESSTTYPLLIDLFQRRARGRIATEQLVQCIEMLRGFILRRFVCGESSRGYGQMFVRALANEQGDVVDALQNYLIDRGWPHDNQFLQSFAIFPLYQRGYARVVLETLERAAGHKEPADLAAAQIEHVMPQTLSQDWTTSLGPEAARIHEEWLHRPGNLTLSAYNQALGNLPFSSKRTRLAESNITMTRALGAMPRWDEQAIRARGESMAQKAVEIWIGPSEPRLIDPEDAEGEGGDRRARCFNFWTGLSEFLSEAESEIPSFEPRAQRALRLSSGVRHIGLELRFLVQPQKVAMDVYFWRAKSHPVWEQLRADPDVMRNLTGDTWEFDRTDGGRLTWMNIKQSAPTASEASWPDLYEWFQDKLVDFYERIAPMLRERMGDPAVTVERVKPPSTDQHKELGAVSKPRRSKQLQFWEALKDRLAASAKHLHLQPPRAQHWQYIRLGRSGIVIVGTVSTQKARLGVEIYISNHNSKAQFQALQSQRDDIEAELGFALDWQALPDAHASRIVIYRFDSPLATESRWDEYLTWMEGHVISFDSVFRSRVRALP